MIRLARRICFRLTPDEAFELAPLLRSPYQRTWSELIRSALREYVARRKENASDNGVRQADRSSDTVSPAKSRRQTNHNGNGKKPQKKRQKR